MATVTGAMLALSFNKGSKTNVPLQGAGFTTTTDVTILYPANSNNPTYKWTGTIHKKSLSGKSGEVKVTQELDVSEKDKRETTDNVSITIVSTSSTITVQADIYEE